MVNAEASEAEIRQFFYNFTKKFLDIVFNLNNEIEFEN